MSAARLITRTPFARTPTPELDLLRVASALPRSPGHFMPAGASSTLCGIELPVQRPVATVRCPRCLALLMPGLPAERECGE